MSRIGKKPVPIPAGVKVAVSGATIKVDGPKGSLSWTFRSEISVKVDGGNVVVERKDDQRQSRALHGLSRSLIANMILGVVSGYSKSLEVYGVGYGVTLAGTQLTLTVGKSHPVVFPVPAGVKVEVQVPQARGETEPAKFTVSGPDKQVVGEFAAQIRRTRPPEPYKGKGIRYAGEHVRRKVGKAFAGAGGGA